MLAGSGGGTKPGENCTQSPSKRATERVDRWRWRERVGAFLRVRPENVRLRPRQDKEGMMRIVTVLLVFHSLGLTAFAQEKPSRARQLERDGDMAAARATLREAAASPSANITTVIGYAEFLDRYRDPEARVVYEKALRMLNRPDDRGRVETVGRRLVAMDLMANDMDAASRHVELYRTNGGSEFSAGTLKNRKQAASMPLISVPGPIRSFARMAALSPDLSPQELLPALARNVVTNGYQASSGNESLEATEYLKLIIRYLSQARELEKLGGESKTIRIETCESTQTGDLLKVLGYRMRGGCGSEVVLETVNATRAFLTIDSGFPLAMLEQALRTNRPFVYDYKPTQIPVLYGPEYWMGAKEKQNGGEVIDSFLGDPSLCRLYLGLSKLDPETPH